MDNDAVGSLVLVLLFGAANFTALAAFVFIPWLGFGKAIFTALGALAVAVGLAVAFRRALMGGGGE